jgi:ABC-type transport system involved in multi-copper enzyme maturation permease subunit
MKWELEEYLSFPAIEIIIAVAIYSILTLPPLEFFTNKTYSNLHWGIQNVFLYLIFVVSAIFALSFSGSYVKKETKLLLSYPVKRWQLFLSKFSALFLTVFVVYSAVFSLQVYLQLLSPFEPMFFVTLLGLFLQMLLFCSIATSLSLIIKSEIISILASILLLYGLEGILSPGSYWSYTGRFKFIFGYFGVITHGELPSGLMNNPTIENVAISVVIPLVISSFLLISSLFYYTRIMEID